MLCFTSSKVLNGVSGKACCTNVGVIFGWIVATLLHRTRDRKVEQKLLDVSGLPSLKWKRGEE